MKALLSKESLLALVVAAVILGFVTTRSEDAQARLLSVAIADSHQVIVVRTASKTATSGTVEAYQHDGSGWTRVHGPFRAWIGRSGWNPDRVEGDGSSPTGVFTVTEAFGLQPDPGSGVPYRRVAPGDWWISDPASSLYNTYQPGPPDGRWDPARGELLTDQTYQQAYRYAAVIDFNRTPIEPGRGSAMFLHVGASPTSGCVALAEADVLALLRWLDPAKRPRIVMGWDELVSRTLDQPEIPVAAGTGGMVSMSPRRVLDTRIGLGASGALDTGGEVQLAIGPEAGVPADASAAVLNLTIDQPTAPTHLTAYPNGTTRPGTSNLNAQPGEARAALSVVRLGTDRRIRLFNSGGRSHVIADLVGYVTPSSTSGLVTTGPRRILDTRQAPGPMGPGGSLVVATGAPPGATAAIVNLTATEGTAASWVAAWAADQPYPGTSNLNVVPRRDIANAAVVPLSADGQLRLLNQAGSVHVVVDLTGFLVPTGGARYTSAVAPVRAVDSRNGRGAIGPLRRARPVEVVLEGVPGDAMAAVVTLTATEARNTTWLRATAADSSSFVSNVNLTAADAARANLAVVALSGGRIALTTGVAEVHVVVDVAGWFR